VLPIAKYILRFLLPWACAGCRTPLVGLDDEGFCGSCWLAIARIQKPICETCGIPLPYGGGTCFGCKLRPMNLRIRGAAEFRGVLASAVHRFKYRGRRSLLRPFGTLLRYAWEQCPELHRAQAFVPIPLYRRKERQRGFNQSELLAQELCQRVGIPVLSLLVRTRPTQSQTELDRNRRRQNVRRSFALDPAAKEKKSALQQIPCLLIDDVCTTGSTLLEAAKVLRRQGIRTVGALVLARDL